MDMMKPFPEKPTLDELADAVTRSLDNAEKAIAALSTMLKHEKLMHGFAVADEILSDVKYAQRAMPVLRQNTAIDLAAIREVIGTLKFDGVDWLADILARAIGDKP